MRSVAFTFLWLVLVGAGPQPASAQSWLLLGAADGRLVIEMPVPFDHPEPETDAEGSVISVYAHDTPGLALRFEVVDLAPSAPPTAPDLSADTERDPAPAFANAVLVSRSDDRRGPVQDSALRQLDDDVLVHQERIYRVGNRLYRLVAVSVPEREDDPLIHRFLNSARVLP